MAFRDEEHFSGNGEKFHNAAIAEAGGFLREAGHGSEGWIIEGEV
jgi:hypothetical protein